MLTRDFSTTFKLVADTELIPNRLYAAANLIYQPGIAREFGATNWQQSSNLGMTAAMAYRITPTVTLGGELQYYRAFDGFGMQSFLGNALYIGPTLHIQRGFWSEVQRVYENRICTSLPSSLRIAWNGVLKPRHFLGVRLAVRTMS